LRRASVNGLAHSGGLVDQWGQSDTYVLLQTVGRIREVTVALGRRCPADSKRSGHLEIQHVQEFASLGSGSIPT
jgi:hypothetical protein